MAIKHTYIYTLLLVLFIGVEVQGHSVPGKKSFSVSTGNSLMKSDGTSVFISVPDFIRVNAGIDENTLEPKESDVKATERVLQNMLEVVSFTLVNADNNTDIRTLNDGDVFYLSELPTTNLNIRANKNNETASKVVFRYDGSGRTESVAPYALFGDNNGNYNAGQITEGSHTLSATPYTSSGAEGIGKTITFISKKNNSKGSLVVDAGPDRQITFPKDTVILTGTVTNADGTTGEGSWVVESGPDNPVTEQVGNTLYVSDLNDGTYDFVFGTLDSEHEFVSDTMRLTVTRPANTPKVVSLTLINADNERTLQTFYSQEGTYFIYLDELPTSNLNMRADLDAVPASSVVFKDSSYTRTERVAPYALFGDSNGDYNAGLALGEHTIIATPYNSSGVAGIPFNLNLIIRETRNPSSPIVNAGPDITLTLPQNSVTLHGSASDPDGIASLEWYHIAGPAATLTNQNTVNLSLSNLEQGEHTLELRVFDSLGNTASDFAIVYVNQSGPFIESFILVDAETDQDIRPIRTGDIVDLFNLPANLSIRAKTTPATVGSVQMRYSDINRVESKAPYSLFGDNNGDYASGNLYRNGKSEQVLEATVYSQAGARGTALNTLRIVFYVIPVSGARLAATEDYEVEMNAFPNPSAGQFNFRMTSTEDNFVTAEIYASDGTLISRVLERSATESEQVEFSWNAEGMPRGLYYCKFRSGSKVKTKKIVLK